MGQFSTVLMDSSVFCQIILMRIPHPVCISDIVHVHIVDARNSKALLLLSRYASILAILLKAAVLKQHCPL